jgi:hypothetical protein
LYGNWNFCWFWQVSRVSSVIVISKHTRFDIEDLDGDIIQMGRCTYRWSVNSLFYLLSSSSSSYSSKLFPFIIFEIQSSSSIGFSFRG